MKEWWSNLSLRDQRMLTFGGVIVGLLLFYAIIWGPYLDRIDAMRQKIRTDNKTLAWMQAADKEMQKLERQTNGKAASSTPVALLSELNKQIEKAGLQGSLTQLKQASQDSIEMHFQKVEFDKLIALLISIIREQSVTVERLSASADNTPGIVRADVVLKLV